MKLKLLILILSTVGILAQGNQKALITFDTVADMVARGNPRNNAANVVDVLGYYARHDGGGGRFIATNTVVSTNSGTRIVSTIAPTMSWERIRTTGQPLTLNMFGAKDDGVTSNDAYLTAALAILTDGETLGLDGRMGGSFVFDSASITKDISLVGINNPKVLHKASATGHMWKHAVPQTGEIRGFVFDGNMANQPTNSFYALLYPYGGGGKGLTVQNNVFRNYKWGGLDFQTYNGKVTVTRNGFENSYKVLEGDTNTTSITFAWQFAPGITVNRPQLDYTWNWHTNTAIEVGKRNGGGVMLFGAESINHVNYARVENNFFGNVGGDTLYASGAYHVGVPAIDWYKHTEGIIGWNVATNCGYYFTKVQQSPDVLVIGNRAHGVGAAIYGWMPGEREQVEEKRFGIFKDNWAYRGAADTIALYIAAGLGSGVRETVVDGFYGQGFARLIQAEGFTDDDGSLDGVGPFIFKNIHGDVSNYGLFLRGLQGTVTIENYYVTGTGSGSPILINPTNTAAKVYLKNVHPTAVDGYAAMIRGVNLVSIQSSSFTETGTGVALDLSQDADGNNIGKVYSERDVIVTGSKNIVAADIDGGYYWEGTLLTHFPSQALETYSGDAASTWHHDVRLDKTSASLLMRFMNTSPEGAALLGFRAGDNVVGQWGVYGTNYSIAVRAGWLGGRSENVTGMKGVSLAAPYTNQYVRIMAGDETERFNVNFGGSHFPQLTASRVLVLDANKNAAVSTVTTAQLEGGHTNAAGFSLGDMTTEIVAGNNKNYWVPLYNGTITGVIGSLMTASSSGVVTYDIHLNGTSIMTTSKIVIDANETSTVTAATAPVLTTVNFSAGDKFTFDIDTDGTGAAGPQLGMYWKRR